MSQKNPFNELREQLNREDKETPYGNIEVPGYVFASNFLSHNQLTGELQTPTRIKTGLSKQLGIPAEAIQVFDDMYPDVAFTAYVDEKYAEVVKYWIKGVKQKMREMIDAVESLILSEEELPPLPLGKMTES